MKSCFFIGHREAGEDIEQGLEKAIEYHITECGVTAFYVGGYGAFDRFAARNVIAAKKRYPYISLYLLIPYHPAKRPIKLPVGFDGTFYPPGMEFVPHRYAIPRANRYMLNHVQYLIAYVWHPASNAREIVECAQRKGIIVTNLGCHDKAYGNSAEKTP